MNLLSWSVIAAVKKAVQIYVSNVPTFMCLLKQLATKVLVPHAMKKVNVLADMDKYFEQDCEQTRWTLRVSAEQWLQDREILVLVEEEESRWTKVYSKPLKFRNVVIQELVAPANYLKLKLIEAEETEFCI